MNERGLLMREICVRLKEEVVLIDTNDISEENLYCCFTKNNGQTIYAVSENQIVGMITVGNFWRNCLEGGELITHEFTRVGLKNEKEAFRILENEKWMDSIPVMNELNQIEKEYYISRNKSQADRNIEIYETINQLIGEMKFLQKSENKGILFLTDVLTAEQIVELRRKAENVVIADSISIDEIRQYASKGINAVCDFCPESYRVRNIFYTKYKMNSICWNSDGKEIRTCMADRANYFKQNAVAIFAVQSGYFSDALQGLNVFCLNEEKCIWNDQFGCLEYIEELNEIECVFALACYMDKPYIISRYGNSYKFIPVLAFAYPDIYNEIRAACYDIAENIIPELQRGNIKTLILSDPDNERDKIAQLLPVDMESRYVNERMTLERRNIFYRVKGEEDEKRINEIKNTPGGIRDGFWQAADTNGRYKNFIGGERYTVGNSGTGPNTFYMFGPCLFIGTHVEDKYTIASYMRPMVPDSYYIKNSSQIYGHLNYAMRANKYKTGDIVMFMANDTELFEVAGLKIYSIIEAYKKVPDLQSNILDMLKHCNQIANEYIAEEIYEICTKEHAFSNERSKDSGKIQEVCFQSGRKNVPDELKIWLNKMSEKYKVNDAQRPGAIVMNCNPFTLGHRYLIEQAAKQVDVLYIFVLEEDRSYFSFISRFEMVRKGVADLINVKVIPGGSYVISTKTMPGYFNKEELPFIEADAAMDLSFFAEVIAREFNISVRFAGEEPKDEFTRKYNESMRRILPEYGIEFYEIPRKKIGETVISASLVRKYLAEHNYKAIENLVMPCIYEYLKQNYF